MPSQEDTSVVKAAEQQMTTLSETASEAYKDQQFLRAAEIFGHALAIAESMDNSRSAVKFRSWQGACLAQTGRLHQALAVLAPVLQASHGGDAAEVYRTLSKYIEIAQSLPVTLTLIEKATTQTERFLHDTGHLDWRHRLLHLQAELTRDRGMYTQSLKTEQEAWAVWNGSHPCYSSDSHLVMLVELSGKLGDLHQAHKYLAEWETQENTLPKAREWYTSIMRSELSRRQLLIKDSIDWGRRGMLAAEQTDSDNGMAAKALVRAFLFDGDIERAREIIGCRFAQRHSENGHSRYSTRLLWGDYHLACARKEAGIAPVDDEFGFDFPLPEYIANPMATRRELVRARHAYDAALKVGKWIDEQLKCNLRELEISTRYARIESIASLLGKDHP